MENTLQMRVLEKDDSYAIFLKVFVSTESWLPPLIDCIDTRELASLFKIKIYFLFKNNRIQWIRYTIFFLAETDIFGV